jgi:hypothetical protein
MYLSAESARHLKELGYPQPKPKAGQVWYSLLDYPYKILNGPFAILFYENLLTGGIKPFDGVVSLGMCYAPTPEEAITFLKSIEYGKL